MVTMKWKVKKNVMQDWRVCLVSWRSAVVPTASSNQEQSAGILYIHTHIHPLYRPLGGSYAPDCISLRWY